MEENRKFAVFIDYDNIEIGVKSTLNRELDMGCILEGVKQRGEIISKIAYGNWGHHPEATRAFAEFGVQMVQRDSTPRGDKNGGDINLALDALEMAFTRDHINSFAIVSGDSDFMPLVNKLKEYNKRVYVVGGKQFTSTILQRNCHEFISYESLLDLLPRRRSPSPRGGSGRTAAPPPPPKRSLPLDQAVSLLERALSALEIRGVQPQLGLLKSTMLQLDPAFTERDFGVSTFSGLMERLQEQKLIKVKTIDHHLVVERLKTEQGGAEPAPTSSAEREEALPALQETLIAYVDLLEMGIPEREVEALMRASDPDFDEADYGFQEFGELLNLACDKGLVRVEADSSETLRYYPGPDLNDPIAPIGPPAARKPAPPPARPPARPARIAAPSTGAPAGDRDRDRDRDREDGSGRRRRRRRRRGGRGRGENRAEGATPAGLPFADESDLDDDLDIETQDGESVPPPAVEEPEPDEPVIEEPEVDEEAESAEPVDEKEAKPVRKKAAKKKAARKKSTRKKAAKKAASDDSAD